MKVKQGTVALSLVCVVLGIMLAVQFRATQDIRATVRYQRLEDITQQLYKAEKERDALMAEAIQLRKSASGFTDQETMRIRIGGGLVALEGPGLIITVDDTKPSGISGNNPSLYLIRDEDLLKVLNELKAAGAEAISINGQRLVANSEVRTAGNALSVNNTRLAAPYEIKAIGEPKTLESALKMRGGVIETLQVWGIKIAIKQQDTIHIPAYKAAFYFEHAKPIEEAK